MSKHTRIKDSVTKENIRGSRCGQEDKHLKDMGYTRISLNINKKQECSGRLSEVSYMGIMILKESHKDKQRSRETENITKRYCG